MSKTKDVRAAVDAELGFDPLVDAADITVRNIAGDVTLTGTVPSYPRTWRQRPAARRVAGVTGVHNHLEVALPESNYRDDVKLAAAANNALAANVTVPDSVEATAEDGNIILTGTASYGTELSAAEAAVAGLAGIRSVSNDIQISYALDPVEVDLHVQQPLDRAALVPDDSDVTADTQDGIITLTGHVRTWAEHDAVFGAALMAPRGHRHQRRTPGHRLTGMAKSRRSLAAAVFLLVLAACTSTAGRPGPGTGTAGTPAGSGPAAPGGLRAVRHVWVIELENQGYAQSFGTPSANPYLARTLPRMGALLENYYAIGHSSAANYVAQVSGQAPNIATQSDCPLRAPFAGQVIAGPYHQVLGEGCAYPAAVQTLGNQLSAAGRSWAAYLQDMGNDPARDNTADTARGPACGHPVTWAIDHTQKAAMGDQYAARHDGFAFFRSVTGNQAYCDAHILSFRPLPGDLARAGTTPAFSWISPNLCDDGHDAPCVTGAPGGLAQADAFLSRWVPKIMAAPAYQDGGLIVVTFDEGSDSAACCGEASGFGPDHPNVPLPGKNGPGGGRIGAVLLSPLIRPGTVSTVDYNHYSLLRTVEDIFGLQHLGDAAMPQVRSFGPDVFG